MSDAGNKSEQVTRVRSSSLLSVQLQTALDIRQSVFGGKNIHVATAHEDLAYSSYVHQYSSGKFDNAL